MKSSRFTPEQITVALRWVEAGTACPEDLKSQCSGGLTGSMAPQALAPVALPVVRENPISHRPR